MSRPSIARVLTPAALGMSCGGGGTEPTPPAPIPVAVVGLDPGTVPTLVPQFTVQLVATPKDAYGNTLAGRTVSWRWDSLGPGRANPPCQPHPSHGVRGPDDSIDRHAARCRWSAGDGPSRRWMSLDQTIATVSPSRVVTGVAPGAVGIGATVDGIQNGALVTVVAPLPLVNGSPRAGGHHSCLLRTGGATWCWGFDRFGELGAGTLGGSGPPVKVRFP